MATYYSQSSGVWSSLTRWDTSAGGGGSDPASVAAMEDNLFIIQAGHTIDFDIDTSGWAVGFQTITITGSDSTPGMLRCDSTTLAAGTYNVKMKAGYSIVGSAAAVTYHGRILANSDGVWATTTALANDRKFIIGTVGTTASTVTTIDAAHLDINLRCVNPANDYVEIYGVPFVVTFTNATNKFTIASPTNTPAIPPNGTPITLTGTLPAELTAGTTYFVKAVSGATGELEATIGGGTIDISGNGSGTIYMHYGCWGPVAQSTSVNTTTGAITWNGVPPAADTAVRIRSSGSLPTGLSADDLYYVRGISSNSCKLSLISGSDGGIVIPTAVGSGNISMYCGSSYTNSKVVNVIQDVTTYWVATAGGNGSTVVLCDYGPANADIQADTIATFNAKYLILTTANVDSGQFPLARLYLGARNVAVRSTSTGSQANISNAVGSVFQCEISKAAAYGYGLSASSNNTITTIIGCSYGLSASSNNTITTIIGCSSGLYSASNNNTITTIAGCINGLNISNNNMITMIIGCSSGLYNVSCNNTVTTITGGTNGLYNTCNNNTVTTITGGANGLNNASSDNMITTIIGCGYGLISVSNNTIMTITGCSYGLSVSNNNMITTITRCANGLHSASNNTVTTITECANVSTLGALKNKIKNIVSNTTLQVVSAVLTGNFVVDDGFVDSANRFPLRVYSNAGTILPLVSGDTGWQTPDSANSWIFQATPNSSCDGSIVGRIPYSPINPIAAYATSGSKTLTYKIWPVGWTSSLDQDDVVLEVSYLDSASGITRTTVYNTSQTYANDAWRSCSVTFNPSQDGIIYIDMEITRYESGDYILIDPVFTVA